MSTALAVATTKATCPWCQRLVVVLTFGGLRTFSTHGPGVDRMFCQGSAQRVR